MTSVSKDVAHQKGWKQLAFNKTSMWGVEHALLRRSCESTPLLVCHVILPALTLSSISFSCLKTGRRIFFTKPKPSHLEPFNGCPVTLSQSKVPTPLLSFHLSLLLRVAAPLGAILKNYTQFPELRRLSHTLYPHIDFFSLMQLSGQLLMVVKVNSVPGTVLSAQWVSHESFQMYNT